MYLWNTVNLYTGIVTFDVLNNRDLLKFYDDISYVKLG